MAAVPVGHGRGRRREGMALAMVGLRDLAERAGDEDAVPYEATRRAGVAARRDRRSGAKGSRTGRPRTRAAARGIAPAPAASPPPLPAGVRMGQWEAGPSPVDCSNCFTEAVQLVEVGCSGVPSGQVIQRTSSLWTNSSINCKQTPIFCVRKI